LRNKYIEINTKLSSLIVLQ